MRAQLPVDSAEAAVTPFGGRESRKEPVPLQTIILDLMTMPSTPLSDLKTTIIIKIVTIEVPIV